MNITQKDLDRVKKRCLESLGDFLSELCRDKLMGPTSVEKIFSFDHTTFKRICEKDQTITVKTMARTMGIIASFLNGLKETCDKELKNLQEDDKMKLSLKRKKIDVLNKKRVKCTEAMEKFLGPDGLPDLDKFTPITYDPIHHDYLALGEALGRAFCIGKEKM